MSDARVIQDRLMTSKENNVVVDFSSFASLYWYVWSGARVIFFFVFIAFVSLYFFALFPDVYEVSWIIQLIQPILLICLVVSSTAIGSVRRSIGEFACSVYALFALVWAFILVSAILHPERLDVFSLQFPDKRWDASLRAYLGPHGPVLTLTGIFGLVTFWLILSTVIALWLRYKKVPSLGLSILAIIKQIRHEVANNGDAPSMLRLLNWSRIQGILCGFLAGGVLLLPFFLSGQEVKFPPPERTPDQVPWIFFWSTYFIIERWWVLLVVLLLSIALWRQARRLLSPDAQFILQSDTRPPVLLLRSFHDDRAAVTPSALWRRILYFFSIGQLGFLKSRLEEVAADLLRPIGPFIAVSEPHETVPPLGAFRTKLGNDWMKYVRNWMNTSRFIVMIAGKTKSVTCELRLAHAAGALRNLLLLFPPKTKDEVSDLWNHSLNALRDTSWHAALVSTDVTNIDEVLALQFIDGGKVRIITSKKRRERDYSLAILIGLHAIVQGTIGEKQRYKEANTQRLSSLSSTSSTEKRFGQQMGRWWFLSHDHSRKPVTWTLVALGVIVSLSLLYSVYHWKLSFVTDQIQGLKGEFSRQASLAEFKQGVHNADARLAILATTQFETAEEEYQQQRYVQAVEGYEKSIELLPTMAAYLNCGNALWNISQFARAEASYLKGLRLARDKAKKNIESLFLANIGSVYAAQGKLEEALRHHQEALTLDKQMGNLFSQANDLTNIGTVYFSQQKYEESLRSYAEALSIHKKLNNSLGQALDLTGIGNIYYAQSKYEEALRYHQDALAFHKQLGNALGQATAFVNIGNVYLRQGKLSEALKLHQDALILYKQIGNILEQANTLTNLGLIHLAEGKQSDALNVLTQAHTLYLQNNLNPPGLQIVEQALQQLRSENDKEQTNDQTSLSADRLPQPFRLLLSAMIRSQERFDISFSDSSKVSMNSFIYLQVTGDLTRDNALVENTVYTLGCGLPNIGEQFNFAIISQKTGFNVTHIENQVIDNWIVVATPTPNGQTLIAAVNRSSRQSVTGIAEISFAEFQEYRLPQRSQQTDGFRLSEIAADELAFGLQDFNDERCRKFISESKEKSADTESHKGSLEAAQAQENAAKEFLTTFFAQVGASPQP